MIEFGSGSSSTSSSGGTLASMTDVDSGNKAAGRYLIVGSDGLTHEYTAPPTFDITGDVASLEWQSGDQRSRIQAAIDTYGHVKLGEGTWNISGELVAQQGEQIVGSGMYRTILNVTTVGQHGIVASEVGNVYIANLTIQNVDMLNDEAAERHGIRFSGCWDSVVKNVRTSSCGDAGIRFGNSGLQGSGPSRNCWAIDCIVEDSPWGAGIEIMQSEYCRIINCTVRRAYHHGIRLAGGAGNIVMGNHLIDNTTSDISLQGYSGAFEGTDHNRGASRNIIMANYLYSDHPTDPSTWSQRGIEAYFFANTAIIKGNQIRHKQTGIQFRSPSGQGTWDNSASDNVIRDCNVPISLVGNQRRLFLEGNTIKNWKGVSAITVDQEAVTQLMDEVFIERNKFIAEENAAKKLISIVDSTVDFAGMLYFRWNKIFMYTVDTALYATGAGLGTIQTTWNGVETNDIFTDTNFSPVWSSGGDQGDLTFAAGDIGGVGRAISDNFNRADSSDLGPDQWNPWIETKGSWAISNSALVPTSVSDGIAIATLQGWHDGTLSAKIDLGGGSDAGATGIIFRSTDDGLNYWFARLSRVSGTGATAVELRKVVNGALQTASRQQSTTITANTYKTVSVSFVGSTIKLFLDGVQIGTDLTDVFNSSAKRIGVRFGTTITSQRIDDFSFTL